MAPWRQSPAPVQDTTSSARTRPHGRVDHGAPGGSGAWRHLVAQALRVAGVLHGAQLDGLVADVPATRVLDVPSPVRLALGRPAELEPGSHDVLPGDRAPVRGTARGPGVLTRAVVAVAPAGLRGGRPRAARIPHAASAALVTASARRVRAYQRARRLIRSARTRAALPTAARGREARIRRGVPVRLTKTGAYAVRRTGKLALVITLGERANVTIKGTARRTAASKSRRSCRRRSPGARRGEAHPDADPHPQGPEDPAGETVTLTVVARDTAKNATTRRASGKMR